MKDKNVKEGMHVVLTDNFFGYGNVGDVCKVLYRDESGLSHRLKNLRTGRKFFRSAHGYRKFKGESK